jgi:hypothetical protein
MGGYVGLPEAWADEAELTAEWVGKAFENIAKLPPKKAKASKKS